MSSRKLLLLHKHAKSVSSQPPIWVPLVTRVTQLSYLDSGLISDCPYQYSVLWGLLVTYSTRGQVGAALLSKSSNTENDDNRLADKVIEAHYELIVG